MKMTFTKIIKACSVTNILTLQTDFLTTFFCKLRHLTCCVCVCLCVVGVSGGVLSMDELLLLVCCPWMSCCCWCTVHGLAVTAGVLSMD